MKSEEFIDRPSSCETVLSHGVPQLQQRMRYAPTLTLWRRNYFLNFSTTCI